mmetsp:Transcript_133071/g.315418  ORF Transcript_133071/g.315418 Transcript_133071/m.315418 type:complete len:419 (+) Transcript_133071:45-1301(+)
MPGPVASIGDLFTSLGAAPPVLGEEYAKLKDGLRPDPEILRAAFERLRLRLRALRLEMQAAQSAAVPQVDFAELQAGRFPEDLAAQVRERGCVVVRQVVSASEALQAKAATEQYIAANPDKMLGFPKTAPMVWEVYWAKEQLKMRGHPNMLATQTALNRLWHCENGAVDVDRPLTYCDRLRIRKAGDTSFTLGPHVDGGSTERWEDEEYRKVYSHIWSGDWESYDAFDATHRAAARYDLYGKNLGACSIFRSFQGWLSLSHAGSGRGALLLAPILREATAFLLLRPFLEDVPASSFCGANPGKVQDLFPEFHQELIDCLVPIPDVQPGDTVWWHCDLIHAVEGTHGGTEDAAVFYIPAVPFSEKNADYVRTQAEALRLGRTPPDFPPNHCEVDCVDRGVEEDLSAAGLQAMALPDLLD